MKGNAGGRQEGKTLRGRCRVDDVERKTHNRQDIERRDIRIEEIE
jgi:hypothetical protein